MAIASVDSAKAAPLTIADVPLAAGEGYAARRQSLEGSRSHRRPVKESQSEWVSWSSSQEEDLIFGAPEQHLFPWEIPDGVTWLEYLFGTHIQMTRALFPEPVGWSAGDQREVVLDTRVGDRLEEIARALHERLASEERETQWEELRAMEQLVEQIGSKFSDRTYAKTRTGEALAP